MQMKTPCQRERETRRLAHFSAKARDLFTIFLGVVVAAIAIASLSLLAVILTGCTDTIQVADEIRVLAFAVTEPDWITQALGWRVT